MKEETLVAGAVYDRTPTMKICRLALLTVLILWSPTLFAQMSMPGMAAMENAVAYLSSGTSIEPSVQAYTFGYERDLPLGPSFLNIGLGFQATKHGLPASLKSIYGDRPTAFAVFLHLRPAGNIGAHMQMMHQH